MENKQQGDGYKPMQIHIHSKWLMVSTPQLKGQNSHIG